MLALQQQYNQPIRFSSPTQWLRQLHDKGSKRHARARGFCEEGGMLKIALSRESNLRANFTCKCSRQ